MTHAIDFIQVVNSPQTELPLDFSGLIQVQNVSGQTLMVVNDVYLPPLMTALVHPDNERVNTLLNKKSLKTRSFELSSSATPIPAEEEPKKKRRKKGPSTSSPLVLDGAVADLAAVINNERPAESVAAEDENVEQLTENDLSSALEQDEKSDGEGSPETDSQSV
jgi:hypothetical protein